MSYICLHCGHAFEQPEAKHYDLSCGTRDEYCPNCGSEDVEEVERCAICGELFAEEEMTGCICEKCLDKSVTKRNAMKYGADDPFKVTINGLFGWVFTEDEINSILEKHFMETDTDWQRQMIREYCNADQYGFAEWIEEEEEKRNVAK